MSLPTKHIAHWIDSPAILKCGKTENLWKGVRVSFSEPGWYTFARMPDTQADLILRVADHVTAQYDLCRKCKPLPTLPSRPETVADLLEGDTLFDLVARAMVLIDAETVDKDRARVMASALRQELRLPPPPPGSWRVEDLGLWRAGECIAEAFEDSAERLYDEARSHMDYIALTLNVAEFDIERWKPVAKALEDLDGANLSMKGECAADLLGLLREYRYWRKEES